MCGPGSYYHLVQIGARLHPIECLALYCLPVFFLASDALRDWFLWNAMLQLAVFIPVVTIPSLITGHMTYVDIGWPLGLVVLGVNTMFVGDGWNVRKYIAGGCMVLHGSRMSLGALLAFYPYCWEEDLPRYKYAKERFMTKDGMSEKLWPVKIQHDTLQQCFANTAVLSGPMALCAVNPIPEIHVLEIVGAVLWFACWVWENVADVSKAKFMAEAKRLEIKDGVLGYAPFDGPEYRLWTLCRHPNYFGEWMSWNAFILLGIPSLIELPEDEWIVAGMCLTLYFVSRFFYDCLMYWTGAEPAEHFSIQKRAKYKDLQRTTRVFFPFEMPCANHARVAGWPDIESEDRAVPLAQPEEKVSEMS